MPVTINDLTQDRKTVTLELPGGDLTVTYRPNQLTPARELAILRQAKSDADDDSDSDEIETAEYNINRQISTFVDLVEAWDFEGPLAKDKTGARLDIPKDHNAEAQAYAESQAGTLMVPAGETVPIRAEFLKLLPSAFLMNLVGRINEDMRPNPKKRRS
jgi:hypothetical protein